MSHLSANKKQSIPLKSANNPILEKGETLSMIEDDSLSLKEYGNYEEIVSKFT
jgi:hypothetical protein